MSPAFVLVLDWCWWKKCIPGEIKATTPKRARDTGVKPEENSEILMSPLRFDLGTS